MGAPGGETLAGPVGNERSLVLAMTASPFFLIAAYLFGMATGWAIFAAARRRAGENAAPSAGGEQSSATSLAPAAREALGQLEAELKTTRALLEQSDAEAKSVSEEIADLDAAIKRANGRLRLVMRAIDGEGDDN